jgi:UDP-GlcNAc3NAcA epimerase
MILTVVGARPQFIKAAAVTRELQRAGLRQTLVHTGQHYDENMSEIFFAELNLPPPDFHLGIGSGSHGLQTGRMLEKLDPLIADTNSTLAAALAASKLCVPVAHVEAGLRSFNFRMPEEQNRIVADHLSSLLFAPTEAAVANLLREGMGREKIVQTGDVMYDAALFLGEQAGNRQIIQDLGLARRSYCLATIHRAENTNEPQQLRAILDGLCIVAGHMPVVLPLHPRTRQRLGEGETADLKARGLRICEPVGYLDMVALERDAAVIATDSGGVQKEAFFHEVPCVTLRSETEWIELVDLGWNRVVPPSDAEEIAEAILAARSARGRAARPYGDGSASAVIATTLARAIG